MGLVGWDNPSSRHTSNGFSWDWSVGTTRVLDIPLMGLAGMGLVGWDNPSSIHTFNGFSWDGFGHLGQPEFYTYL